MRPRCSRRPGHPSPSPTGIRRPRSRTAPDPRRTAVPATLPVRHTGLRDHLGGVLTCRDVDDSVGGAVQHQGGDVEGAQHVVVARSPPEQRRPHPRRVDRLAPNSACDRAPRAASPPSGPVSAVPKLPRARTATSGPRPSRQGSRPSSPVPPRRRAHRVRCSCRPHEHHGVDRSRPVRRRDSRRSPPAVRPAQQRRARGDPLRGQHRVDAAAQFAESRSPQRGRPEQPCPRRSRAITRYRLRQRVDDLSPQQRDDCAHP